MMKRRNTRSAKHKSGRTTSLLTTSKTEPPCYRCSKCGLFENRARTIPIGDDYPSLRDLGGVPLWQTCPDEGPEVLRLWDPENPKNQRIRYTFTYGEFKGRVCSPFVRNSPVHPDAAGVVYGPACFLPRMQLEWFVQEFSRVKGVAGEIDLANLLPAHRVLSNKSQGISKDSEGNWLLSPPRWQRMEKWLNEALNPGVPLPNLDSEELFKVVQVLSEAAEHLPHQSSDSRNATLYVPVDLRYSVDEQWNQQVAYVKEIQSYLLLLSRREGVFKIDPDVIQTRLRCFVLREYGGLNSSQIAKLVFPKEKTSSAAAKVRNEISLLRRQLHKSGLGV